MAIFEEHRIKNGLLTSGLINIPINFGLIFNDDGIFTLDLYVSEKFDLLDFMNNVYRKNINQEYKLECLTENNNNLELTELHFSNITPHISKVKLNCYGEMKHVKTKSIPENLKDKKPKLHYLVLEGLKMEFSDITEEIKYRRGKEIENFNDWKRDHTDSVLRFENHPYNQLFYKDKDSENIIVEFPNDSNNTMTYEKFCEIKTNYLYALSFLNGAEVKIRKVCTGSYYTVGKTDSEIVITYSFKKLNHLKFNKYIPLNNPFNRGDKILNQLFVFCFDSFTEWNKKIDLNTIIFYLNNSEQAKSIDERVFIQMIAFERLTTMYSEFLGEKEEFMPSQKKFEPIKNELFAVLDKHKMEFGHAYEIVKSKIGNINQIKRLSTKEKMFKLIQDVKIPISPAIENLVNNVRNKTIHKGDIGTGKEGIINFYLLDELIREIILRLINYNGKRESIILLKKENTKA